MAIHDLHSRNIMYRDLKPANIVLDDEGHIQLIDFGICKEDITEMNCGSNELCGTLAYMPPEMIRKSGHGKAVDWYQVGVLLY